MTEWIPYIFLLFLTALISNVFPKVGIRIVIVVFELLAIIECVTLLWQIGNIGIAHYSFASFLGTFNNPGPLGGYLATIMSVASCDAFENRKYLNFLVRQFHHNFFPIIFEWLSLVVASICLVALPFTLSRTAWVAAIVPICVLLIKQEPIRRCCVKHKGLIAVCILTVVVLGIFAFNLKRDSAIGRFHIWHMELLAIAQKPLTGWGFENILGAYGMVQHDYFAAANRSPIEIAVAGCPEYPFSEYLGLGMAYGIPALLASLILLTWICYRLKRTPLLYGLIAIVVFSCASYPLSLPQFRILSALMFGKAISFPGSRFVTIFSAILSTLFFVLFIITLPILKAQQAASCSLRSISFSKTGAFYPGASDAFLPLYDKLYKDYHFLYEYGYALYCDGNYERSIQVLRQGAKRSSDPMFHNLIGLCHQSLGDYDEAIEEFQYSHQMVPCRILPIYLEMLLYNETGDREKVRDLAQQIQRLPINNRNSEMVQLQTRSKLFL